MKTILVTLLLISQTAFAAPSKEVIKTTGAVRAGDLKCGINLGQSEIPVEDRMYITLASDNGPFVINIKDVELELPQATVYGSGCDVAALDKLVEKSFMFFGFLHGTPITITKTTLASVKNALGQCQASYSELIEIDLEGHILSGGNYTVKEMNDC